jgi:hypothetical protein
VVGLTGLLSMVGSSPLRPEAGSAQASGAQSGSLTDCYVLGVGIDKYAPSSGLGELQGDCNDALNLSARVKDQEGKLFTQVQRNVLTDAKATGSAVLKALNNLRNVGKAGDWYVLVLSGHGGQHDGRWAFMTQDGTRLMDTTILDWADALAAQGKKVWIMIDACQSGQIRHDARELLERYQNPKAGGIILMLACVPSQLSQSLGKFSSFAQSANEALNGDADYNGDGYVTLREVRQYTYHRTYELIRQYNKDKDAQQPTQDSMCLASLSISDDVQLAVSRIKTDLRINTNLTGKDVNDPLRPAARAKVFQVELKKGITYRIDMKSSAFDTYLRLLDGQGKQLAYNDDVGGTNLNSQIIFTPSATGTYRLVATTYTDGATGPFTLTVRH